jgi:hypothetical protein
MDQPPKTEIVVYKSKQWKNATYRCTVVQPRLLCCELLMEMKQMVAVSPVCNAFRQKGLMSSGRSLAKLFNSRGSNRKYKR